MSRISCSLNTGILCAIAWFVIVSTRWALVVHGFNVDISNPLYYIHSDNESQFGLTLALHREDGQNMLLVGAPRAQSEGYRADQNIWRSGALLKCPIDISRGTPFSEDDCQEIIVDTTGNEFLTLGEDGRTFQSTNASGQWLGSTLQSGGPDGSVVVCRPLYSTQDPPNQYGNIDRYLRGGCFVINGGLTSPNQGVLDTSVNFNPCADNRLDYRKYYRCEFGGSAAVRGTRIVYGATGSCLWNGKIWYTNGAITENSYQFNYPSGCRFKLDYEYYFGHAVAFGNFRDGPSLEVAIGAPRWNHGYGRVFLYSDSLMEYDVIEAFDLATYFGHALATSDLNNDGSDDIVISAPMFTDEQRSVNLGWEVGKVYIYYNDQQGGFFLDNDDVMIGTGTGCRFGYSLAALGDINNDGFNDLAVGAPFCDGGDDGKVFIYHGSGVNQPLNLSPQQIISATDLERPLKFFGFVMSAGLDLDDNSYLDFAVGAHQSQTAVIFRSRAVVMTIAEIYPEQTSIDLDLEDTMTSSGVQVPGFNVTICLQYSGEGLPNTLDFSYQIVLDSSRQAINRRGAFLTNNLATLSGQFMTASAGQRTCLTHAAYVKPTIRDKQTPMRLLLVHGIAENSQSSNALQPVMSNAISDQTFNSIAFARNCAGDTCYPDLAVQANATITRLTIGKVETFVLNVDVVNHGEDAFLSVLDVVQPPGLFFVSIIQSATGAIVSCTVSGTTRSCNIGNPISNGDQMKIGLKYQTTTYSSFTGSADLQVSVRSIDDENEGREINNMDTVSLPVFATSSLILSGNAVPDALVINEDNNATNAIGPLITHEISFQNDGPSFIGESYIEILWPKRLQDGKTLMNVTDVTTESGVSCQLTPKINDRAPRENNITEFEDVERNLTIYTLWADCDSLPECVAIRCPLTSLATGSDSAVIISVQSRLWHEAVFAEGSDFLHFIQILSTASVTVNGTIYPGILFEPHPTVSPLQIQTEIRVQYEGQRTIYQETPIWIYLAASMGGLLVLIVLILILYKMKFFNRRRVTAAHKELLREVQKEDVNYDEAVKRFKFFKRKQITHEQRELLREHRRSMRKSQMPEQEPSSPSPDDETEESPLQREGSVAGLIK